MSFNNPKLNKKLSKAWRDFSSEKGSFLGSIFNDKERGKKKRRKK